MPVDILHLIAGLTIIFPPYGSLCLYEHGWSSLHRPDEGDFDSLLNDSRSTFQRSSTLKMPVVHAQLTSIHQPSKNTQPCVFPYEGSINAPISNNPHNLEIISHAMGPARDIPVTQEVSDDVPLGGSQAPSQMEGIHCAGNDALYAAAGSSMGPVTDQTLWFSSPPARQSRAKNCRSFTPQLEALPTKRIKPSSPFFLPEGLFGEELFQGFDGFLGQPRKIMMTTKAQDDINSESAGTDSMPSLIKANLVHLRRKLVSYPEHHLGKVQRQTYPIKQDKPYSRLPRFENLLLDENTFLEFPFADGYDASKRESILSWIELMKQGSFHNWRKKKLLQAGFRDNSLLLEIFVDENGTHPPDEKFRSNLIASSIRILTKNENDWFNYWESQKSLCAKIQFPPNPGWYPKKAGEIYTIFLFYAHMFEVLLPVFGYVVRTENQNDLIKEAIQIFQENESKMEWCLEKNGNNHLVKKEKYPYGIRIKNSKPMQFVWDFLDVWLKNSKIKELKEFYVINGGLANRTLPNL